jgi:signal recognition particle subunit SRP9
LIKATPSEQWLILKVTDDQTCLKFRARSAIIINRFEAFTRAMTARMAGLPDVAAGLATSTANSVTPNVEISNAGTVSKATSSTAQQSTASSAAAKKKKKKGKK